METLTYNLSRWTTSDLLDEVVRRSATDGPALQLLEMVIIRARLADRDRKFGGSETRSQRHSAIDGVGLRGTTEMGVADEGAHVALLTSADHQVGAETLGAHAHDHTHRRVSSAKFAAHEHPHLHLTDMEADARLNGHGHAQTHSRLPWEDPNPA